MVYRHWTNDSVSDIVNCISFLFLIILSVPGTIIPFIPVALSKL